MKFDVEINREREEKTIKALKEMLEQKDRELDDLRKQQENRTGLQNPGGSLSSLTDILNDEELGKMLYIHYAFLSTHFSITSDKYMCE